MKEHSSRHSQTGHTSGFQTNPNRAPDGTFTTFDAPGAGTGPSQGTFGGSINSAGEVSGTCIDASNVMHGYLRAPDGTITTYDAPDAGTGANQGTSHAAIIGVTS